MMDLNTIWFILVGVLLTGYAVLDGFDLGTGALILFVRDDTERRIFYNAIGPVWNGNEVWLVTGGGALFAAFPNVYATVFSGFYDAFMLLLTALIFRAAAIEFRGQYPGARWRATWDTVFAVASISGALVIGVAIGNLVWGIPLDAHHEFHGDFLHLIKPYTLLVALTGLALFAMHANLYLSAQDRGCAPTAARGLDQAHDPHLSCAVRRAERGHAPRTAHGARGAPVTPAGARSDLHRVRAHHVQHRATRETRAIRPRVHQLCRDRSLPS